MKIFFSILLIIGPVLFFGYFDKTAEMGIALLAGFVCAVFINLDKFSSFKAGKMEANLRDVINEANATIDQLKSLTEPLMQYNLAHIARGNRTMGVTALDKEKLYLKLKENVNKFELRSEYTSELLQEVEVQLVETSLFEVEIAAEQAAGQDGKGWNLAEPLRKVLYNSNSKSKKNIGLDTLRPVFNEHPYLYNKEVEKALKDYERFLREYDKPLNA